MAGNLSGLHVFAADAGPEALSLLDGVNASIVAAINTLANYANYYVDGGVVNALLVTVPASQLVSYVDGLPLDVKVTNTNTLTAVTLAINALAPISVADNYGMPLAIGALQSGRRYRFMYDQASNLFICMNPTVPSLSVFKAASTARANTIVLANDPDLQLALPKAGTYRFELFVLPFTNATITQGMQVGINYSGAFTSGFSVGMFEQIGAATTSYTTAFTIQNVPTAADLTLPAIAVSALQYPFRIIGTLFATAAGTFGFSWAQAVSNANSTNVAGGSYLKMELQ